MRLSQIVKLEYKDSAMALYKLDILGNIMDYQVEEDITSYLVGSTNRKSATS